MGDRVREAAERLWVARATGRPCAPVRDLLGDADIEAAYQVQAVNTARWRAAGRRVAGWKIGLTSQAVQRQLGVSQPDFGALFADDAFGDGEPIPWARLQQPKAEGEIAFVLERDLDLEAPTPADIARAVAFALPAIEIVGSRIADWDIRITDTIADHASAGVYVLGTRPARLRDFDPRLCGMVLERRGEPESVGAGAACLGNPLSAVRWLARTMVERGEPLRAGDVVLSGALGPLIPIRAGDVLELRISGVGEVRAVFEGGA
jgi:2-keto-4-pentenoate hydratase